MWHPRLATALVILLIAGASKAFLILQQTVNVQYVDGAARTAPTAQGQCQSFDYDVPTSLQVQDPVSGTVHNVVVTCNMPKWRYLLEFYAFIVRTNRMLRSTITIPRNSARFNNANTTDVNNPPSEAGPMGRTLLQHDVHCTADDDSSLLGSHCETTGFMTYPGIVIVLKVQTNDGSQAYLGHDAAGNRAPGEAELAASDCVGNNKRTVIEYEPGVTSTPQPCYNEVTAAQLDLIQDTSFNLTRDLNKYGQSYTALRAQSTRVFNNLTASSDDFTVYLRNLNQTLRGQELEDSQEQAMSDAIKVVVTSDITNSTKALLAITTNLQAQAAALRLAANTTGLLLDQQLASVVTNKGLMSEGLYNMTQYMADRIQLSFQAGRTTLKTLGQYGTLMDRYYRNEDILNAQSAQIHQGLTDPDLTLSVFGTPLHLFADNEGVAPADNENDLGPELSLKVVNNNTFRYAQLDAVTGTTYSILSNVVRRCGSLYMIDQSPSDPTDQDIFAMDSPPGCDHTYSGNFSSSSRCLCFSQYQDTRCPIASSSDVNEWDAQTKFNLSSGCLGPYVAFEGGVNGTLGKSIGDTATFLSTITLRGPPLGGGRYYVYDHVSRMRNTAQYVAALGDPNMFLTLITSFTASGGLTSIATSLSNQIARSWKGVWATLDELRVLIKGTPPNDMDQSQNLWNKWTQGTTGRGSLFQGLLIENYFLTVNQMLLQTIDATMDVVIDGVATHITDVQLSNLADWLHKPQDIGTIVMDPTNPNGIQYDIPAHSLSLSSYAYARRNHVTALMNAGVDQFSPSQYLEIEGVEFIHRENSHPASPYGVPVDTNPLSLTYRQCLFPTLLTAGNWCLRRQRMQVVFTGPYSDFNTPGSVVLGDPHVVMTATIPFPVGNPIQSVSSACPDIRNTTVSGSELNIYLLNTQPGPNANTFEISQLGASGRCDSLRTIVLQPGESFTFTAVACPYAPSGMPDVIYFLYLPQGQTTYSVCPVNIPLTYSPTSIRQYVGEVSLGMVYSLSTRRANTLLLAIDRTVLSASTSMGNLILQQAAMESSLGFRLPAASVANTASYLQQMHSLQNLQLQASAQAQQTYSDSLTQDISDFDAAIDAEAAATQINMNQLKVSADTFAVDVKNSADSIDVESVLLTQSNTDLAQAATDMGPMALAFDLAVQDFIRVPPGVTIDQDAFAASQPWGDVADFTVKTIATGGAYALISILGKTKVAQSITDMLNPGSSSPVSGFAQVSIFVILVVLGLGTTIFLARFYCRRRDRAGNAASLKELQELQVVLGQTKL